MTSNKTYSESYYCDTIQQSPLQKSYESSDNLDLQSFTDNLGHASMSLENLLLQSPQEIGYNFRKLGLDLCEIKQIGFVLGRISNKIREKQREHCQEFLHKLLAVSSRQKQTAGKVNFLSNTRRRQGEYQLGINPATQISILNLFRNSQINSWSSPQNPRKAYPVKCQYKQFPKYWQYYLHEHKPTQLTPQNNHTLQNQIPVTQTQQDVIENKNNKKRKVNLNKCSLKSKPL